MENLPSLEVDSKDSMEGLLLHDRKFGEEIIRERYSYKDYDNLSISVLYHPELQQHRGRWYCPSDSVLLNITIRTWTAGCNVRTGATSFGDGSQNYNLYDKQKNEIKAIKAL